MPGASCCLEELRWRDSSLPCRYTVSDDNALGEPMFKHVWKVLIVSGVCLSGCDNKYDVGGTVTGLVSGEQLQLEDNGGDTLTITENGTFTFATGVKNGDSYAVTVSEQPGDPIETCTVQNGSGTIDKLAITHVVVTCTKQAVYAYVVSRLANTISQFAIDASTGALTEIGTAIPAEGSTPVSMVVDPNGNYAYVANNGSDNITVYAIDTSTGVLTVSGSSIASGTGPVALAIDPTDSYLYVANHSSNDVSIFSIDSSTGALTAAATPSVSVGQGPDSLAIDPGGNYLYVANYTDGTVSVFAIDPTTGALTAIAGSPFGAGTGARSVAIDPAGTYAYVANESAKSISAYAIDSTTGGLTVVSGSPFTTDSAPEWLAVNPAGSYVYTANTTAANDLGVFTITPATGALSATSSATSGSLPVFVTIDPAGTYAYVANGNSSNVSVFAISGSTLTAVPGSPYPVGSEPSSIAVH